jgi:hypothetical protein
MKGNFLPLVGFLLSSVFVTLVFHSAAPVWAGTFFDDFNDGNADGWTVLDEPASDWDVVDGGYHGEIVGDVEGVVLIGEPDWQVESIQATIRDIEAEWLALVWRWEDVNYFDGWWINVPFSTLEAWPKLGDYEGGARVAEPIPLDVNEEHTLTIVIVEDTFEAYFDDEFIADYTNDELSTGQVGLLVWNGSATFDNVRITGSFAGGLTGDFDSSGALDASDIDDLTGQSAGGTNPSAYDLNADSLVNDVDVNVWVKDLYNSWIGDADLNGEFNSSDLVVVLASGTYEADVNSVWTTGDFNGDGRTNSSDLVAALADGGYEGGPRAAVGAVPEPASGPLLVLGLLTLMRRRPFAAAVRHI